MVILPDSEFIVIKALQGYHPETFFRIPADLHKRIARGETVLAVYKTGGKAPATEFLDNGMFTVQTFSASRREASRVARHVRAWLRELCRNQTLIEGEGFLAHFRELSGPMPVTNDELSSNQPELFRFVATYMVSTKPVR
ncbi:hypothetical protein ACN20G_29875 (plasmid) [Streptomyces sp. BI20]|uniref:phage tail termination protein n=1 Tax=Streptomyces sp. BI20 TaxID=3403460 RepID=UPI003C723197